VVRGHRLSGCRGQGRIVQRLGVGAVRAHDVKELTRRQYHTAVTTASHATRPVSNLPAERDPRTAADTTLPTRASRRSANARVNRRNGTTRKIICHQCWAQNRLLSRAVEARNANSATNTNHSAHPATASAWINHSSSASD
jgi:hypothetical protein